tara:strand:+ start:336 stop:548 length:213 start_codon:yes stop_codon:yes gene_type:complete
MNKLIQRLALSCTIIAASMCTTETFAKKVKMPEVTTDGLVLMKKPKDFELVYLLPGADLSIYQKDYHSRT